MKLVHTRYGRLAIGDQEDLITNSLVKYGEWAQNEIWFMERLIPRGGVVLDIGAYIGTHTLAFSKFVSPAGRVLSFEPQPTALAALRKCKEENRLENVSIFNLALGDRECTFEPEMATWGEHNRGSFSLLGAINSTYTGGSVPIKPMDSLDLDACDILKIDVEGMESHVLRGAIRTIKRFRPLVFCECNFLEVGLPVLSWAAENHYAAFGVVFAAFNKYNLLKSDRNIFGESAEVSIVLAPDERLPEYFPALSSLGATELKGPDDLALLLFRKPQYVQEVIEKSGSPSGSVTSSSRPWSSSVGKATGNSSVGNRQPAAGGKKRSIRLVVPFYKNQQLVRPLFKSLLDSVADIDKYQVRIFFYNDSPDAPQLKVELDSCLRDKGGLDLTVCENGKNLGFVCTVNNAFDAARLEHEDVLLLNSDTRIFRGAITELVEVAYSDPMIGFVSPRSNNATLCTLPHGSSSLNLHPDDGFKRFQEISGHMPRLTYVPTAVGFCLFIKWTLLAEFGGFDTIYGKGYNEENDLIMRANRCGYRSALANHAFVWHAGEQSFNSAQETRLKLEKKNADILRSRYPEYPLLVNEYYESPEYRAEELLETMCADHTKGVTIGFDFCALGTYYDGTSEAGKRLLFSSVKCWAPDIRIVVFMGKEAWDFHGMAECQRAIRIDPDDMSRHAAAIVRMGQPFDIGALKRLYQRAPVIAIFMLDTIASDCGNLRMEFDQLIWQFVLKWSDVVFTNSRFSADQFFRRYALGQNTLLVPSLHSLSPEEYVPENLVPDGAQGGGWGRVLVIGNKFAHKAMVPTVQRLASCLPMGKVVALGCPDLELENVEHIQSGALTEAELAEIYGRVEAIVFPSHYEGFGFPILHALARSKPIYVRNLPAFREIVEGIKVGAENVHWFESTEDLAASLTSGVARWQGPMAAGEESGWDRSAKEVLAIIQMRLNQVQHTFLAERLRWFNAVFSGRLNVGPQGLDKAGIAAHFIRTKTEHLMCKALSYPFIYGLLRTIWLVYKKVRRISCRMGKNRAGESEPSS